jgi:hypothetical protein
MDGGKKQTSIMFLSVVSEWLLQIVISFSFLTVQERVCFKALHM